MRVRPSGRADIEQLWHYIADDDIPQADRFVDRLDETFRLLAQQPLMGRARDELGQAVRSHPFQRYVIFYEPLPSGIAVIRVLHSARDVVTQFTAADE
ncbi:type II toxin-antitoxin system RelE/ParE family toxin [Aquabacterium sp. A7-Y]|uniref:type II toxin-antitoxin system RelE/ParE family toxin n=1 Tax=Aquabacterium sp. A7-Y TaxID=1349605 RepID=UPI00223D733E|nr:type II toxin-antitoxin system RelE/ParE family toxin [Aquabacterium sp. A7-Y]MCW7540240.1 type II toxin-antitoxin system RelE/ParE family toxin [Aquabacterium sp. A7-Y]